MFAADAVARHEMGFGDAAKFYDVGESSVRRAFAIKERSIDVASEVRTGKINLTHAARRAGFVIKRRVRVDHRDVWDEIVPPAITYAQHWVGREYAHLNPKEAKRRLSQLRELQEALHELERDIGKRSISATLSI